MTQLSDPLFPQGQARDPNRHINSSGSAEHILKQWTITYTLASKAESSHTFDLLPIGNLYSDYEQNVSLHIVLSSTLLFFASGLKRTHIIEVHLSLEEKQPW